MCRDKTAFAVYSSANAVLSLHTKQSYYMSIIEAVLLKAQVITLFEKKTCCFFYLSSRGLWSS